MGTPPRLVSVVVGLVTALTGTAAARGAAASGYSRIDLGTLGGAWSTARAINDVDVVAGDSATGDGSQHGFVWSSGRMMDLGTLGGTWSHAVAVTSVGDVAGNSETSLGAVHGFWWHAGVMTDLGTLGGPSSTVTAANGKGMVVGESMTTTGDTHAFLWSGSRMTDLGTLGGTCSSASAINGRGQVVGVAGTTLINDANPCGELHPFVWQRGVMTDLNVPFDRPPDPFFHPRWTVTINDQGTVAGSYTRIGDSGSQAAAGTLFRWTGGSLRVAGPLVDNVMTVTAENSRGDVTGVLYNCCDDTRRYRGIVWAGVRVTYLAWSPSAFRIFAVGISGSGTVAGYYSGGPVSVSTPGTAFVWNAGTRTDLGSPGDGAQAAAINA